jgi:hypothetical protein
MDPLTQLLVSLGTNVASSYIYDLLIRSPQIDEMSLIEEISTHLNISNAQIAAKEIVEFLAKNGDISIVGSTVFANSVNMQSHQGTVISMTSSLSETSNTKVSIPENGSLTLRNGGRLEQGEDFVRLSA